MKRSFQPLCQKVTLWIGFLGFSLILAACLAQRNLQTVSPEIKFTAEQTTPVVAPQIPLATATSEPTTVSLDRLMASFGRHWSARLAVSNDRNNLAIAFGNELCLYTLPDLQRAWCTVVDRTASGYLWVLAYQPQAQMLAMGLANGRIVLVESGTGMVQRVIQASVDNIRSLAWSPDGELLASGSDAEEVRIWNTRSGELIGTLAGDQSSIIALAWSPDGSTLAGGTFLGNVTLWNVTGSDQLAGWKAMDGFSISNLAWTKDSRYLYAGASYAPGCGEGCNPVFDGLVTRLDGNTLERLSEWDAGNPVQALVLSPDEAALAVGLANGAVQLLSADLSQLMDQTNNAWSESGLAWLPSDELFFLSRIRVEESGADLSRFPANIAPDHLIRWDPASDHRDEIILPGEESVFGPVWTVDGSIISAGTPSGNILLWNIPSGSLFTQLIGNSGFSPAAWSLPDGRRFARLDDADNVVLFNTAIWEVEQVMEASTRPPQRLLWSPDGKWLAGVDWENVTVWNVENGEIIFRKPTLSSNALDFSPDGSRLVVAAGDDGSLMQIWEVHAGQLVQVMQTSGWITSLDWNASSNGEHIAVAQGGWAEVWDVETGEKLLQISSSDAGHSWGIDQAALSPDGTILVTAAAEIILWDIASGEKLERLEGHTEAVTGLSFSPNGKLLASASREGVVMVWDIESTTTLSTQTANRAAAITPLPTRTTPTVYPPYEAPSEWPVFRSESFGVQFSYPPNWQVISDTEIRGEDGFFILNSLENIQFSPKAYCQIQANTGIPKQYGQYPYISDLWQQNAFYGCIIASPEGKDQIHPATAFIWYPQEDSRQKIIELQISPPFLYTILNGLRLTESIPQSTKPSDTSCKRSKAGNQTLQFSGLEINIFPIFSTYCQKTLDLEANYPLKPAEANQQFSQIRQLSPQMLKEINQQLAPFQVRLENNQIYHQDEKLIESGFSWAGLPVINQSATDFYLPLIENSIANTTYLVSKDGAEELTFDPFYSSLGYVPRHAFLGDDLLTVAFAIDHLTPVGSSPRIYVKRNQQIIFTYTTYAHSPAAAPVRGLYTWNGHWILELPDILIQDGIVLNEKFNYPEMFTWQLIDDKPFFFYRQADQVHISYDGQTPPLSFTRVFHEPSCCSAALLNMTLGYNGLGFFAEMEGQFVYVIVHSEN
jgi:WD40 repeat protein